MEITESVTNKRLQEITSSLENISGNFGPLKEVFDFCVTTNDQNYLPISQDIKKELADRKNGIAFYIGSGGVLSQLPEIKTDVVVVTDMNIAILKYNKLLVDLIKSSSNKQEVLGKLVDDNFISQNPILDRYIKGDEDKKDLLLGYIKQEAIIYGKNHWSNDSRFIETKKAISEKNIIFVSANITNSEFVKNIKTVSDNLKEPVVFANLTNVHQWIGLENTVSFINNFPFSEKPAILFSHHVGATIGDYPRMQLAIGLNEYLSMVKRDLSEGPFSVK